jgi:hypothetical protein
MTSAGQASPAGKTLRTASLLGLVMIAALLAWAFLVGRNAQTAADAAERAEIAQEDRTLCIDLGFDEHDGKYRRCTDGLAEIRRRQKERWVAASP